VHEPGQDKKAAKLVKAEEADSVTRQSIAQALKGKASTLDVGDETRAMVDAL
jgi:hypothetical protein